MRASNLPKDRPSDQPRVRRTALLGAAVLIGTAVTACGPTGAGFAAVTVEDGEVVALLVACDTDIVTTTLYDESGSTMRTITHDARVPEGEVSRWRTGLRVADPSPDLDLEVNPRSDDIDRAVIGTGFDCAAPRRLPTDHCLYGFEHAGHVGEPDDVLVITARAARSRGARAACAAGRP